jgi:hypothetical protein
MGKERYEGKVLRDNEEIIGLRWKKVVGSKDKGERIGKGMTGYAPTTAY